MRRRKRKNADDTNNKQFHIYHFHVFMFACNMHISKKRKNVKKLCLCIFKRPKQNLIFNIHSNNHPTNTILATVVSKQTFITNYLHIVSNVFFISVSLSFSAFSISVLSDIYKRITKNQPNFQNIN